MKQRFLIKDIALQAGLSTATIDRVLHNRGHVRTHTRRRVEQALTELERQEMHIGLTGRKFIVDLVMQAPRRIWEPVREAMTAEAATVHPALFRTRYHLSETLHAGQLERTIDSIQRLGSHGVILNAPDTPTTMQAISRLADAGIPVVTFTTDLPNSRRIAFVGMDNRAGGATAGYLIGEWLSRDRASVLVTLRGRGLRGEEEREIGFRKVLRTAYPHLDIVDVTEGMGADEPMEELTTQALKRNSNVRAIYSIGGGNLAIAKAIEKVDAKVRIHLGHDLDADNVALLRGRRMHAILHHDMRHDMREACIAFLRYHGVLPGTQAARLSTVQIITPMNLPGFLDVEHQTLGKGSAG